jgi:hypothetical protein
MVVLSLKNIANLAGQSQGHKKKAEDAMSSAHPEVEKIARKCFISHPPVSL